MEFMDVNMIGRTTGKFMRLFFLVTHALYNPLVTDAQQFKQDVERARAILQAQ
ncbi:MAG: hypothetical protein NT076_01650 [Candidatus Pacearchaeota archaeon]|nr:hypothetical protein [Candidatus Pacearchaeota archaeon]